MCFPTGLSYCRHLKTVRTHLSGLVNTALVPVNDPCDASAGLTAELWTNFTKDGLVRMSALCLTLNQLCVAICDV